MEEIDIQVQEAQGVPNKINSKKPTLIHIIIKMTKVRDRKENLKKQQYKCHYLCKREQL